jgi:hypothetical protein
VGKYTNTLAKRLRGKQGDDDYKHDPLWYLDDPAFDFEEVPYEELCSREKWHQKHGNDYATKEKADLAYDAHCTKQFWFSEVYSVTLDKQCRERWADEQIHKSFGGNPLWHMKINRLDRAPCHHWQVFQTIKNLIVGSEFEAIELYPAHSRLMDAANEYHLWILAPKDEAETPPQFKIGVARKDLVTA